MASAVINTRADLDAIAGTPEHMDSMAILSGSLFRLEKDDILQTWKAVEDNSTIERFGFTRADFPNAVAPELPVYVPVLISHEQMQKNAEARGYLASTDWYIVRKTETGVEIPADVVQKRQAARAAVV